MSPSMQSISMHIEEWRGSSTHAQTWTKERILWLASHMIHRYMENVKKFLRELWAIPEVERLKPRFLNDAVSTEKFMWCRLLCEELISWSNVLLEKLIVTQLLEKFSAFYGTRKFITVFTRTRQRIRPIPRFCVTFRNKIFLHDDELLAPRSNPEVEDHPL